MSRNKLLILFWLVVVAACTPDNATVDPPFALKCEYAIEPVGVEYGNPGLSWIMVSGRKGQRQTAYEILVSGNRGSLENNTGDLWESGRVDSDQSQHVVYGGKKLPSRASCWWKVRIWDADGKVSDWSDVASWKMGLSWPEDWKAGWIGYACESAPLLRKSFVVNEEVEEAYLYISGLGYYEVFLNGSKVGDNVLDPGQTDYEKRTFYVSYDMTGKLKQGENVMGVILGNGWYNQNRVNHGKFGWKDVVYGSPRVIAQLHLVFGDGREEVITSDESWSCFPGPILSNNIYSGEVYDARRESEGWSRPGFDDSGWSRAKEMSPPGGKLVSQKIQPIKKNLVLDPVSIRYPKPGICVLDMGQNFSGWIKLKHLDAEPGTSIRLRFSESLDDRGMIDPASTGVYATYVVQTDSYICKGGGDETWEPRFTYHGFRYVEVSGFPGRARLSNFEGIAVYSAMETRGEFECSDALINRIHQTALWTLKSNVHSIPTDCPHRERCGWLGDAHLMAEMAMFNFDSHLFWKKYVRDIETTRAGGLPPNISPGRRFGGEAKPDWGSAFIILPWYMYLYYGDISVAEEHWEGMSVFMRHCEERAENFILNDGLGDLFAPGSVMPVETPVALTSTAFFYYDALIMARMAEALGKEDEAGGYTRLARQIKTSFIRAFFNMESNTYGSQTANSLALFFELTPEGKEQQIAESLAHDIDQRGGHHSTGIMGSRHLYWVLGHSGFGSKAYEILNQTGYPGFRDLFRQGATTCWEYWGEAIIDSTSLGVRSKNHPFQGAFDAWFYNGIAGINPDPGNPGFKRIIFRPQIINDLSFARASYMSDYGLIKSEWERQESTISWEISVPANTTALVYIPTENRETVKADGSSIWNSEGIEFAGSEKGRLRFEVGSGEYYFSWAQTVQSD